MENRSIEESKPWLCDLHHDLKIKFEDLRDQREGKWREERTKLESIYQEKKGRKRELRKSQD